AANQYCVNYTQRRIYLSGQSTFSGHTVEYSGLADGDGSGPNLLQFAFVNTSDAMFGFQAATGVTVANMKVTEYANLDASFCDQCTAAGPAIRMNDNWLVTGVLASLNHGCALAMGGTAPHVTGNTI